MNFRGNATGEAEQTFDTAKGGTPAEFQGKYKSKQVVGNRRPGKGTKGKTPTLARRPSLRNRAGIPAVPTYASAAARRALSRVLSRSIVTVSGPTPPGTGVMAPALSLTESK